MKRTIAFEEDGDSQSTHKRLKTERTVARLSTLPVEILQLIICFVVSSIRPNEQVHYHHNHRQPTNHASPRVYSSSIRSLKHTN